MGLTKTNDVSKFFKHENNQWIFTGTKLEVLIPKDYFDRKLLTLGDIATSLGIFQIRINDTYFANFMILARLNIEFITYRNETIDDTQYIILLLEKNSVFIQNSKIVKDSNLIYEIFVFFLALGKIPSFIQYEDISKLFDNDSNHCGVDLKINHSIYEMIYAHMFRDNEDPYRFYRHTMMNKQPVIVPIRMISHGPTSTSARITGSYLNEGLVSSLVDETERAPSKIENLFRA